MSEPPILQRRRIATVVLNSSLASRAADPGSDRRMYHPGAARAPKIDHGRDSAPVKAGAFATERRIKSSTLAFWLFAVAFAVYNTIFVPTSLPSVPLLAGANLYPADLTLGGLLLVAAFYRVTGRPAVVQSPLSKYVLAFLLILLFEALYAIVVLHRPPLPVLVRCRIYAGYALYFPALWALGTIDGVRKLIRLWAVLAVGGAILYIFQVFHGELAVFQKHAWLFNREIAATIGGGAAHSHHLHRLFSQGTVLFRIMLFVAFTLWLLDATKRPRIWLFVAAVLAVQVLLQFTRGMYLTTVATLLVMPMFVDEPKVRRRLVFVTVGAAAALGFVIVYKLASGGHSHLLSFIWDRFSRVFTHASSDTSIQDRLQDAETLLAGLSGHWILGLGLGNGIDYGDSTYVSLLLDTGILGTAAFIVLFSVACLRGLRHFNRMPSVYERALLLALTLSTGRTIINAISQSDFTTNTRIPALIVSVALMEILISRGQLARSRPQSGRLDSAAEAPVKEVAPAVGRILAARRPVGTDRPGPVDG